MEPIKGGIRSGHPSSQGDSTIKAETHSMLATRLERLGKSNVYVSRLGVGCSPMGGAHRARMSDEQVHDTVSAALGTGVNYLDVAPHYGQGYAEKRLGVQLGAIDRAKFVISTKVGVSLVAGVPGFARPGLDFDSPEPFESKFAFAREPVKRSLEASLERLKIDRIDVVLIHDPDEAITLVDPNADPFSKSHFKEVMDDVYPYLDDLKRQGVIGAVGVGINQWQMCCEFARAGQFDCFLLARQFTLACHEDALVNLVPLCLEKDISLIIGGPYHNGILATGTNLPGGRRPFMDTGEASDDVIGRIRKIEAIAADFKVPLQSAALQFPFRSAATASVIPGVRSRDEFVQNLAWFETPIPAAFWSALRQSGLIHPLA